MEGCLYLGIRNTFMVPVGVKVNRRQYDKSFSTLKGVAWECYNAARDPEKIQPLIDEAKDFPDINAVVLDDFVRGGNYKTFPPPRKICSRSTIGCTTMMSVLWICGWFCIPINSVKILRRMLSSSSIWICLPTTPHWHG